MKEGRKEGKRPLEDNLEPAQSEIEKAAWDHSI